MTVIFTWIFILASTLPLPRGYRRSEGGSKWAKKDTSDSGPTGKQNNVAYVCWSAAVVCLASITTTTTGGTNQLAFRVIS